MQNVRFKCLPCDNKYFVSFLQEANILSSDNKIKQKHSENSKNAPWAFYAGNHVISSFKTEQ